MTNTYVSANILNMERMDKKMENKTYGDLRGAYDWFSTAIEKAPTEAAKTLAKKALENAMAKIDPSDWCKLGDMMIDEDRMLVAAGMPIK